MSNYSLTHLEELEAEAIYVIREVYAQFDNPAILFSGGKDSIVVTHLARKAFWPAKIPFPLVHIDTGHNFPETMEFRDNLIKEMRNYKWVEDKNGKLLNKPIDAFNHAIDAMRYATYNKLSRPNYGRYAVR